MSRTITDIPVRGKDGAPASAPPPVPRSPGAPRLGRIVRHEWRLLAADRTLALVALLFAVMIGYGVVNGVSWTRFQERALAEVAAEESARLEQLRLQAERIEAGLEEVASPFRDPRQPGMVGASLGFRNALLPPAPLAPVSVGQSDLYPYYVPVTTRSRDVQLIRDEIENPVHLLTGRFDLAFVIVFLYPLLILAISYDLLSQEREAGTLGMLLSQPVGLGRVVGGKVLARLVVVLGLALVLTLLGLAVAGVPLMGSGVWPLGMTLLAVITLYGAFWFALAAAVNALGRSSATNAVALASVWLAFVIVIPATLNVAAATLYPVPSRVETIGATREAAREAQQEGSARLARYYEEHPELAPAGEANLRDFATLAFSVQEAVDAGVEPVRARFESQLSRQHELLGRFRFASPAILTQQALNDLAGNGEFRYGRFREQADAFHAEWRDFFRARIYRQERLTSAELADLPAWSFREEPTSAVAARVGGALVALVLAVGFFGALGAAALRRYPRAG